MGYEAQGFDRFTIMAGVRQEDLISVANNDAAEKFDEADMSIDLHRAKIVIPSKERAFRAPRSHHGIVLRASEAAVSRLVVTDFEPNWLDIATGKVSVVGTRHSYSGPGVTPEAVITDYTQDKLETMELRAHAVGKISLQFDDHSEIIIPEREFEIFQLESGALVMESNPTA